MKKMSCGNCGYSTFSVLLAKGHYCYPTLIYVKCLKCGSTSKISVTQPTMEIEFGENSDGRLCILATDEDEE
jgi:RNase P subunit RPR2